MRDYDTVTKTVLVVGEPFDDQKAFLSDMAEYARLGVDTSILVPRGDPVAYTERTAAELVGPLAELPGP
jgi:hypothetical protein